MGQASRLSSNEVRLRREVEVNLWVYDSCEKCLVHQDGVPLGAQRAVPASRSNFDGRFGHSAIDPTASGHSTLCPDKEQVAFVESIHRLTGQDACPTTGLSEIPN